VPHLRFAASFLRDLFLRVPAGEGGHDQLEPSRQSWQRRRTTSPYGAFDMGGNVFQWNETLVNTLVTGSVRGGAFDSVPGTLPSSFRGGNYPTLEGSDIGFRVASTIPEPSTGVLAVIGGGMMWWWRKRFK
jgi:hypothetical protein